MSLGRDRGLLTAVAYTRPGTFIKGAGAMVRWARRLKGTHTQTSGGAQMPAEGQGQMQLRDRGLPVWGGYISLLFSVLTGICVLGLATVTVFLQDLIVARSDSYGLMALLAVGAVPVIGLVVVGFGASKALGGFRFARKQSKVLTDAVVGVLVFIALSALNPLVGLGIPIAAALAGLGMVVTQRLAPVEPAWDFDGAEAVGFLSGRDRKGLALAQKSAGPNPLMGSFTEMAVWVSVLVSCGLASWLAASQVVAAAAVPAVVLCSAWASFAVARQMAASLTRTSEFDATTNVRETPLPPQRQTSLDHNGLVVDALSVVDPHGRKLLAAVDFEVKPGQILGLLGGTSQGKSVLAQAIMDPFGMDAMTVTGCVQHNGQSLWDRSLMRGPVQAVHVGENPALIQASALENLCSFNGQRDAVRVRQVLETLTPSSETLDRILAAEDATTLSRTDQKTVEFARSFFLSPALYIFDRPEDHCSADVMEHFAQRLAQEKRAGRAVILITENRALRDMCDVFMVMENGRRVDIGPAGEVSARRGSGWQRFTCDAVLDAEEALESWLRTRFRRKGDEANRRRLCTLGAELLALACQHGDHRDATLAFDFKHFVGHCVLRLTDDGPLFSSGQIQRATQDAHAPEKSNRSPLALVLAGVLDFEQATQDGRRTLTLKIQSDDPRKAADAPAAPAKV